MARTIAEAVVINVPQWEYVEFVDVACLASGFRGSAGGFKDVTGVDLLGRALACLDRNCRSHVHFVEQVAGNVVSGVANDEGGA